MDTSRNKQLWYLWLARDERQPHPKNQDELEPGKDSYTHWMSIPELLK